MSNDNPKTSKLEGFREVVNGVDESLTSYAGVWGPTLQKTASSLRNLEKQLLEDNDSGELSVTAQIILEQAADRVINVTDEFMRQHKNVHNNVSKIGKSVERHFGKDVGAFFAHEKDLERDTANREQTCSIIHDFLMSEGMIDEAELLRKEALLARKMGISNADEINEILDGLANKDVTLAVKYLTDYMPNEKNLIYELNRHNVLRLVTEGREVDGLKTFHCKKNLGKDADILKVVGAAIVGTTFTENPIFQNLYDEYAWKKLISKVSEVISPVKSNLLDLMDTGKEVVSVLTGLKRTFSKGNLAIEDELPVEIKVKKQIHSTFTCPILKEQSTEKNPPMKLLCGHVISREAMNRLTASRLVNPRAQVQRRFVNFRQTRLKCPYCPKEQNFEAAKQVLFSHVQF